MKIRAYVAVRDPVVRRTLAAALKSSRDIVLVPLPEEADVVVDEAAVRAGARLDEAENGNRALTRRELSVLRLVALGLGNKEIASQLGISTHTVKYHLASLLAKLGVHSRTEAVTMGLRKGLVPL
ncbi:MAG: response regulator transcription factor [Gemmatimonadales bacterium]